jgi:hypothetical protein
VVSDHEVAVHGVMGAGFLAKCSTCGWRGSKWRKESQYAQEDGDRHVYQARALRHNNRPPPSAKTAIRIYRENAESETYTPSERDMWRQLADELEIELAARTKGPVEGQMELF